MPRSKPILYFNVAACTCHFAIAISHPTFFFFQRQSGFVLFIATVITENQNIRPIAFAVAESDKDESTVAFVLKSMVDMCPSIPEVCECFFTDAGIPVEPVKEFLPTSIHVLCSYHWVDIDVKRFIATHCKGTVDFPELKIFLKNNIVNAKSEEDVRASWEDFKTRLPANFVSYFEKQWLTKLEKLTAYCRNKGFNNLYEASSISESGNWSFKQFLIRVASLAELISASYMHVMSCEDKDREVRSFALKTAIAVEDCVLRALSGAAAKKLVANEGRAHMYIAKETDIDTYEVRFRANAQSQVHKVCISTADDTASCTCLCTVAEGIPCSHIMCVVHEFWHGRRTQILEKNINPRWRIASPPSGATLRSACAQRVTAAPKCADDARVAPARVPSPTSHEEGASRQTETLAGRCPEDDTDMVSLELGVHKKGFPSSSLHYIQGGIAFAGLFVAESPTRLEAISGACCG